MAVVLLLLIPFAVPNLLIAACAGDINRDGRVDGLDLAVLGKEMGRKDCFTTPCKSDLNDDGAVDDRDKIILYSEVGRRDCLAEAAGSPENGGRAPGVGSNEAAPPEKPPVEQKEEVQDAIKIEAKGDIRKETKEEKKEAAKEETQEGVKEETTIAEDADSRPLKAVKKKKPEPVRFIDHDDGTVTDRETGLMWARDADLPAETLLYYEALSYIDEMNKGNLTNFGYTDWRLPTLEELRSLKDFTDYTGDKKYFPPEGHPFENVRWMNFDTYYQWPTYFWNTKLSWMVSAYCRLVGRNTITCVGYLWPVRGDKKD